MIKIALAVMFAFVVGCGVDTPAPAASAAQQNTSVVEEISPDSDGLTKEDLNEDGATPYTCQLVGASCTKNSDCCGYNRGVVCHVGKCSTL